MISHLGEIADWMSSSFDGNDPRCLLARLPWYGCAVIAWNRLREETADKEIAMRNRRLDALLGDRML